MKGRDDHFEHLGIDVRIVVKWFWRNKVGGCVLELFGSGWWLVIDSSEMNLHVMWKSKWPNTVLDSRGKTDGVFHSVL